MVAVLLVHGHVTTMKLLFFGAAADIVGTRETELALGETSLAGVIEHLKSQHSGLCSQKLLFAVNEEYSDGSVLVSDGDEIAIFTAVSGG